jgi:hypothetical protein
MSKLEITIVYSNLPNSYVAFEDERARITYSDKKIFGTHNVGVNWYSIPNPDPDDSILIIEPRCVNEKDYNFDYVSRYNKIFTWAVKAFEHMSLHDKVVEVNYYSVSYTDPDYLRKNWLPWKLKSNEVVFVANNKTSKHPSELYSLRMGLADYLSNYTKFKVSWYGNSFVPKPYYRGKLDTNNKIETLKSARFSICCENSYDPIFSYNFFSEKMPDVLLAGTIPLYMGCYNIDSFNIPPYLDLRRFVQKEGRYYNIDCPGLVKAMEEYDDAKYEDFLNKVEANLRDPYGLHYIADVKRVYNKIIETFSPKEEMPVEEKMLPIVEEMPMAEESTGEEICPQHVLQE